MGSRLPASLVDEIGPAEDFQRLGDDLEIEERAHVVSVERIVTGLLAR